MSEKCFFCGTTANVDGFIDKHGRWVCVDCAAEGNFDATLVTSVSAYSPFYTGVKNVNIESPKEKKNNI